MGKRSLAIVLAVSLAFSACSTSGQPAGQAGSSAAPQATTPDQQALDKLLAPIALYPDALLAQVLACASSPQQVTEVNKWLKQNSQLQGSDRQAAAEQAGFDASFVAIVLFPDVLELMEKNMAWTEELGKAFTSDQTAVLDSVQRLRAQAQAAGSLKTTPQQEVKTETQNGQTVIVVQPANPQVVYVPVYNPQTVYTVPPPDNNNAEVAAAAVIGFALGVALAASMDNNYYGYYGWGAWGMHWHTHVVVVHGGAWHVPPHARYPYTRPVPYGYHPNTRVYAPTYNNVNINVNRQTNVANTNAYNRTPRPTTYSGSTASTRTARPTTTAATTPSRTAQPATRNTAARSQPAAYGGATNNASRGRTPSTDQGVSPSPARNTASPARQMESGSRTSAFSGYQSGSSERAASSRGRSSASTSSSGGGRRRR